MRAPTPGERQGRAAAPLPPPGADPHHTYPYPQPPLPLVSTADRRPGSGRQYRARGSPPSRREEGGRPTPPHTPPALLLGELGAGAVAPSPWGTRSILRRGRAAPTPSLALFHPVALSHVSEGLLLKNQERFPVENHLSCHILAVLL